MFEINKKATLFTIDLTTGLAKILTKYDKEIMYNGIAIPTRPVAYAVSSNTLLIFNPSNTAASLVLVFCYGLKGADLGDRFQTTTQKNGGPRRPPFFKFIRLEVVSNAQT